MEPTNNEIATLESLLNEFFTQSISNERRRGIEHLLEAWQQQEGCWSRCFQCLAKTNNEFVTIFCLNSLEVVINKQWMGLLWEDRSRLKSLLYQYSIQPNLSNRVVGKTVKLVVDTARLDWPHFYPDFFTNVLELLRRDQTLPLGLLYLLTISQELGNPRQDLSVARTNELQKLLGSYLPRVFTILSNLFSSGTTDHCLVLQVLSHLFTWVPAEHISQNLVTVLFRMALDLQSPERALLALSTLNEMLYRHWTPPCWSQFLQFVAMFLQSPPANLEKGYLEKMCDLIRMVLTAHMSRDAQLMEDLLTATLRFTERQQNFTPGFTSCLQIWNQVLDHPSASKYGDTLVAVAELIVLRIQWRHHEDLISDDDEEDEEVGLDDTPWQRALRPCLEVIARVAELRPTPVLNLVVGQWIDLCGEGSKLNTSSPKVEVVLRDLSSLTRAVGRLCPLWGDVDQAGADSVVRPIVTNLKHLSLLQYHSTSDSIKIELLCLHCEALAALKACCYWLTRLPEPELREVTQGILNICIPRLAETIPRKLQHCAAHLFSTITATVRLPDTWSFPPVRQLFDVQLVHLQQEDIYLVGGGLVNCLILPTQKTDTCINQRLELADKFADRLTEPLMKQGTTSPVIADTLRLLGYLVRLYSTEGSRQKKVLCLMLKNAAEKALQIFPNYVNDPIVSLEILQFFLTLLECLQTQVGVAFVQGVVQTISSIYSRDRLNDALQKEDGGGLEQVLGIVDSVVQTPALSAAGLTPVAVELCLQLAPTILAHAVSPSVQEAYYRLIYRVLEHKWQYFLKSPVDSEQRIQDFLGLLSSMAAALMLTDINLFRLSLSHFEKLNQRWNLYKVALFKKELLPEMLSVLLATLVNKSHALLADDIALSLCHLISADPDEFFSQHLPTFLHSVEMLDTSQREILLRNFGKDLDLPSLSTNIFRLVNDLGCYQLCNVGQTQVQNQ